MTLTLAITVARIWPRYWRLLAASSFFGYFIGCVFAPPALAGQEVFPLQLTSETGALISEIPIDLGDRFSGEEFVARLNFSYRFRNIADDSTVILEVGSCSVGGRALKHISAKVRGNEATVVRDLPLNGFSFDMMVSSDDETEGLLLCRGAELRELTTGKTVAAAQISGFFRRKPRWMTRFGHCDREVQFSFDQKVASHHASSPVDSSPTEIRLAHAVNYPAAAVYSSPKNCRIGKDGFDAKFLLLRINDLEITDNGVWSIPCSCFYAVSMRIDGGANMGDKHGSINCEVTGGLTYTY